MDNPGKEPPKEPQPHKDLDESSKGKRKREDEDISTQSPDQKRYKAGNPTSTEILDESDDSAETGPEKQQPEPSVTCPEYLEPIYLLRSQLKTALSKLPKPPPPQPQEAWGKLLPQTPNLSPVPMVGQVFTIGRSSHCNLSIRDPLIPSTLCKVFFLQGHAYVECSSSGALSVNQRALRRESKQQLRNGDELTITGHRTNSYIFSLQPTKAALLETSEPIKLSESEPLFKRNRGAKELPLAPVPGLIYISAPASTQGTSPHDWHTGRSEAADIGSLTLPKTEETAFGPQGATTPIDTESAPSITVTPPKASTEEANKLTKFFKSAITPWSEDFVSFENFPYYLDEATKLILVSSLFIFLEKPHFADYAKDIPSLSRKILLAGHFGTQIYQETLVKALAHHFKANLLVLDSDRLQELEATQRGAYPQSTQPALRLSPDHVESPVRHDASSYLTAEGANRLSIFQKGDRVRYTGPLALPSPLSSHWNLKFPMSPPIRVPSSHLLDDKHSLKSSKCAVPFLSFNSHVRGAGPPIGMQGQVLITFDDNPRRIGVRFDKPIPGGLNLANLCEDGHGFFVDASELKLDSDLEESSNALAMECLFEVLNDEKHQPIVLFAKNLERLILHNVDCYNNFKKQVEKLKNRVVVIGWYASAIPLFTHSASSITSAEPKKEKQDRGPGIMFAKSSVGIQATTLVDLFQDQITRLKDYKDNSKSKINSKLLLKIFSSIIDIKPPENPSLLAQWNKLIERDIQKMKNDANIDLLSRILLKNNLTCPALGNVVMNKAVLSKTEVEKLVGLALCRHIMLTPHDTDSTMTSELSKEAETSKAEPLKEGSLIISPDSISYAFRLLKQSQPTKRSVFDTEAENEFEKRLLSDVIPPAEIDVKFDDIGALDAAKDTLKELVMLPLQRPELFAKGNLTKPCKGILLFGPPGTGKTMLAKAVATEAGQAPISYRYRWHLSAQNGSGKENDMHVLCLHWLRKYHPALFLLMKLTQSLADVRKAENTKSTLAPKLDYSPTQAMRKIKTELMIMWDGLKTRENERVLVLAATNRPFDLDEAVLRRLPRRLLVDLPDVKNRNKILRLILKDEDIAPDFDYDELATMTDGFSGSDLKNLCVTAAYQPIREFLDAEKKSGLNESSKPQDDLFHEAIRASPVLRALTLKDFKKAKTQISASVSEDAFAIAELRKWNETFGEGGNRSNHGSFSYYM